MCCSATSRYFMLWYATPCDRSRGEYSPGPSYDRPRRGSPGSTPPARRWTSWTEGAGAPAARLGSLADDGTGQSNDDDDDDDGGGGGDGDGDGDGDGNSNSNSNNNNNHHQTHTHTPINFRGGQNMAGARHSTKLSPVSAPWSSLRPACVNQV